MPKPSVSANEALEDIRALSRDPKTVLLASKVDDICGTSTLTNAHCDAALALLLATRLSKIHRDDRELVIKCYCSILLEIGCNDLD